VFSPVVSNRQPHFNKDTPFDRQPTSRAIDLLLGGYSFGSLILVRLPSLTNIINTFEAAEHGTSAAETFLRARALARQTQRSIQESHHASTPRRSRKYTASSSYSRSSPITVGGEETHPSERRRSKDSHRRSISSVRELPHRIKSHVRRHSGSSQHQRSASGDFNASSSPRSAPQVTVRYLLVSPVLFPLSTILLPPGLALPKSHSTAVDAGVLSLKNPTFLAFGDSDTFTSGKKLRQWAERLASESKGSWKWTQVDCAGHFWREDGAAARLESELAEWLQS
jgi:alpha/beta superfamily hydrolase